VGSVQDKKIQPIEGFDSVRGEDIFHEPLFTTVQLETFVPADHPLRAIKSWLMKQ
jgi:hypothetical protein